MTTVKYKQGNNRSARINWLYSYARGEIYHIGGLKAKRCDVISRKSSSLHPLSSPDSSMWWLRRENVEHGKPHSQGDVLAAETSVCRPQLDWSSRQLEMMVTKPRIWWMLGQWVERDFDNDDEVLEGVCVHLSLAMISLDKIWQSSIVMTEEYLRNLVLY